MTRPPETPPHPLPRRSLEDAVRALRDAASRLGEVAGPRTDPEPAEDDVLLVHTPDGRTLTRR